MKKIKLLLVILIISTVDLNAQINLVSAAYSPSTEMIYIVKWQALDSGSVITIPSILEGYYFGSSAFDAFNGNYYLTVTDSLIGVIYEPGTNAIMKPVLSPAYPKSPVTIRYLH